MMKRLAGIVWVLTLVSCVAQKKMGASNGLVDTFVTDSIFKNAQVGLSVYDPSTGKYVYDYQADKFFVPASNMKIFTCYASMKYLKHFLSGIRYYENDTAIYLLPTGDPTLLHRDFPNQPVIRFLQQQKKRLYVSDVIFQDEPLGRGWSWDDYNDAFMTERNALPVYGNAITWIQEKVKGRGQEPDASVSIFSDPEVNWKLRFDAAPQGDAFHVQRDRDANVFHVAQGKEDYADQQVPFVVNGIQSAIELLTDTIGRPIGISNHFQAAEPEAREILSQPVDSALRRMMYISDNFFAEQLLEMVSTQTTGVMNDARAIDTIMKMDFNDLPQKPVWVDGSGMSRYNLSSPHIFVSALLKMKDSFGMERVKLVFPAGDSGTLKGYYNHNGNYLYAKTGSMTGVISLSGYLYAKNGKMLVFSVLVNNFSGSGTAVRRRVERFVNALAGY